MITIMIINLRNVSIKQALCISVIIMLNKILCVHVVIELISFVDWLYAKVTLIQDIFFFGRREVVGKLGLDTIRMKLYDTVPVF